MFSAMCVCHTVCPQSGSHLTITHDTLDLTVQGHPYPSPSSLSPQPSTSPQTSDLRFPCPWPWSCTLLLTSGVQHCRAIQTFSLEDLLAATSGSDNRSTYGLQACSMHPTGILFFKRYICWTLCK